MAETPSAKHAASEEQIVITPPALVRFLYSLLFTPMIRLVNRDRPRLTHYFSWREANSRWAARARRGDERVSVRSQIELSLLLMACLPRMPVLIILRIDAWFYTLYVNDATRNLFLRSI